MVYFTADLHLGHSNIIRLCDRPFSSVDEMDVTLIRNWNNTVTHRDEVYILGDFTMKPAAEAHDYLAALHGRKFFIRGNHDRFLNNFEPYEKDLEWIKDYFVLRYEGKKFVLFHYPIAEWQDYYHGAIHLFGHIHLSPESASRVDRSGRTLNVGVDCHGFRPVSIRQIIEKVEESL